MSVAGDFVLPGQPATGSVFRVPLGGDGFSAPMASYTVRAAAATGDGSGGELRIRVGMDPIYTSLIAFVEINLAQVSSGDVDYRLGIFGDVTAEVSVSGTKTAISATLDARTVDVLWTPPPRIYPGGGETVILFGKFLNVTDDVITLNAVIYLFDIRVRELSPMGPLLWALTGGDKPGT